ncbi:hypothetical protein [cf. Phormidesmis sp. LEGE 11477]|uniref:hypothetical protein n=1 Tax=cf. Phormidesmis sp. LEGE 11477 TaxID=1828680 RepID=UPI00187F5D94|nr:hypothetical protein [cf. Phormidesmis sp. LEGE 11477]MBE9062944.1 hypothetical protein [cf. Phormidesmis sp. LEGE 11477]
MKLIELKSKVYQLAKVTTSKQLKAQYQEIKPLDLRYKASWEKALAQLQHASKSKGQTPLKQIDTESTDFKEWLSKPPSEYKELFADAGAALASFGKKLDQTKKLTKTAKAMAASLDEFAEATVEEAQRLISTD